MVLVARDPAALDSVMEQLPRAKHQRHGRIAADFADPESLRQRLVEQLPTFGPIDLLVNNTEGPPGGLIQNASTDEFLDAFSKHLLCNQILTQAVLADMKRARFGRIVNIVSISAREPLQGLGVSNTVRGAVVSWAKTLAAELGPFGITVNNILPGYTETARLKSLLERKARESNKGYDDVADELKKSIPLGRFASPDEIANVALFLASDHASYVSGISLPVDGGRLNSL